MKIRIKETTVWLYGKQYKAGEEYNVSKKIANILLDTGRAIPVEEEKKMEDKIITKPVKDENIETKGE